MASADRSCDICIVRHLTHLATRWCSECEQAICNACEEQHSIIKATRHHKTISIEDFEKLPPTVASISHHCDSHNHKFDFYCSFHNAPCCVSCINERHKECRELKPLLDVIHDVKSSAAFEDLQERAKNIYEILGTLIKKRLENRSTIENDEMEIIKEISHVRKSVNAYLDKLEKEIRQSLSNERTKCTQTIDNTISSLTDLKTRTEDIVSNLDKANQHGSDLQTFLCINKWNAEVDEQEAKITSLQEDQSMNSVKLSVTISPKLKELERDVVEFGKVMVDTCKQTPLVPEKKKQGQIILSSTRNISQIKLNKVITFDIPKMGSGFRITGCKILKDGRMIIADFANKRLVIMSQDGNFISNVPLKNHPFDVITVDDSTIAVTLPAINKILLIDMNTHKTLKSIPVGVSCFGISYNNNTIVVSDKKKILLMDLNGNVFSQFSTCDYADYNCIHEDSIYYATDKAVYSCDFKGNMKWEKDIQGVQYSNGLTTDKSGNVYATTRDGNSVVVISSDGKETRVLLTKEDRLDKPRAIHYNRTANVLLVCNRNGPCFLFSVE